MTTRLCVLSKLRGYGKWNQRSRTRANYPSSSIWLRLMYSSAGGKTFCGNVLPAFPTAGAIVMQTSRLLEKIYSTLPIKTLKRMEGICRNGEIVIRLRPPCSIPDHVLVNEDDMRRLINCAMATECAICLRDGREIDACPLRKILESIVPPEEYSVVGCSYRNIAISNEYGKYI